MRAVNKLSTILALSLAVLLFRIGPAGAALFEVKIDASGVLGDVVMAFDFTDSDSGANHQLDIRDFASDGVLDVSATADPADCPSPVFPFSVDACKDPAGSSVTGTLGQNPPDTVRISDAGSGSALITYFQRIDLSGASQISFRFEMSGDPTTSGAIPDGLAFSLLDLDGAPIVSPDPSGLLILYTFGGSCDTEFSDGLATCTEVRVPSVPEPAPLALTVAALLALISARWRAPALQRRRAVRA